MATDTNQELTTAAATVESEFNKGFILPPLIIQLRKILDQYPDDTQILKELIQNAEDAGATGVKFLLDTQCYGTDNKKLTSAGIAKYQGPALYAYNDAVFNESDWKGIRMLLQSVKQNDPHKVGYFGMGFKSVFHITDLPSVLSGDYLGIIDPLCQFFDHSGSHAWSLSRDGPTLLTTARHQLDPYLDKFDCTVETFSSHCHYNGTLFRFPLRSTVSPLSDVIYSVERIRTLLESFQVDAHLNLIFLRSIEQLIVYELSRSSVEPMLRYQVHITESCVNDVRQKRRNFVAQTRNVSKQFLDKPVISSYQLTLSSTVYPRTTTTTTTSHNDTVRCYLVTNYHCGGPLSASFRKLQRDSDLRLLPCIGTAMSLDDVITTCDVIDGRTFCFLPLPSDPAAGAGLPVHVNGSFALESNRKYIKWPSAIGSERSSDEHLDKHLLWNQCLLREALPFAYCAMLLEAITLHGGSNNAAAFSTQTVYRAFPDFSHIDRRWEPFLPILFAELFKHRVVHTEAEGGHWIEARYAVFNTLTEADSNVSNVILNILADAAVKVVDCPLHVLRSIRKCCRIILGEITPVVVAAAIHSVQHSSNSQLSWDSRIRLLRYFLSRSKYDLLDGLELLPLANGGFTAIRYNPRKADRPIYTVTSVDVYTLLLVTGSSLEDDFLDMDIDKDVRKMLLDAVKKGYTQVKLVDAASVGSLLSRSLPRHWLTLPDTGYIQWIPGDKAQPPIGWLESLWNYLRIHSPTDLHSIEKLPIIPVRSSRRTPGPGVTSAVITDLVPLLHQTSALLVRRAEGISLGNELETILVKIGIIVVDSLPDYIRSHAAVERDNYLFAPTYIGVLRSIEKQCHIKGRQHISTQIINQTNAAEKRRLREVFAKISVHELQPDHRDLLTYLPLFETVDGSGGSPSHFVCCADVSLAAPVERASIPLSRPLLDISSSESLTLSRLLGVRQLVLAELFTQFVFSDIENAFHDSDSVRHVMSYVIRNYHRLADMDHSFCESLSSLAFIERRGTLMPPNRFYDPDDELLRRMFCLEENFPTTPYTDSASVAVLREVGLRGVRDVDAGDVRDAAGRIAELVSAGKTPVERLADKSNAILEYLQRYPDQLSSDCGDGLTLAATLSNIPWARRTTNRPAFYPSALSWYSDSSLFHCPSQMVAKRLVNSVGSVMPVAFIDVSVTVEKAFGWDAPPSLDAVTTHLGNVVCTYTGRDKPLYGEIVRCIYAELSHIEDRQVVVKTLQDKGLLMWLWHGDGFTSVDCMAFVPPTFMDLRPFVYAVPPELTLYSDLLTQAGVTHNFQLSHVLAKIRAKHDNLAAPGSARSLTANLAHNSKSSHFVSSDVKRDLHICVSVLNELKSQIVAGGLDEQLETLQTNLLLPVQTEDKGQLKLAPLAECTYCDEEWLRQGYTLSDLGLNGEVDESLGLICLVHPNVPTSTSEVLGVPTLMSRMLSAEQPLDFGFGQCDTLTSRLKTLLQDYSDGLAVPKELIQNADDAGATEVRFLYDERDNIDSRTCLLDDGMKECQGAALWVYNDAVFTDNDLDNITRLGAGSKISRTDQVGRFGLGFNSVYNVTDVPSFISRHSVVIFDPHSTHLGRCVRDKLRPGVKIDLRRHRRSLKRFGNQFRPWDGIFGCDLLPTDSSSGIDSYPGTLFRLPLRTVTQAGRSEIAQQPYTDKDVKDLLTMLVHCTESLLLFAQNVVRISIYHLAKRSSNPRDPVPVFVAERTLLQLIRELTPPVPLPPSAATHNDLTQSLIANSLFLHSATKAMSRLRSQSSKCDKHDCPRSSLICNIQSSLMAKGAALLEQTHTSTGRSQPGGRATPGGSTTPGGRTTTGGRTTPGGRMPQEGTGSSCEHTWLICNVMSCGESLKISLEGEGLLPCAGVAVRLEPQEEGHYRPLPLVEATTNIPSGAVFSFLPLPIRTGLPVHINGCFAVTSSRKHLCQPNEDDKFDPRPVWNRTLLHDAVRLAYIDALIDISHLSTLPLNYDFTLLWPNPQHIVLPCDILLSGFYSQITQLDTAGNLIAVFSDGDQWADISNSLFLDTSYSESRVGRSAVRVFRQCVSTQIVCSLPPWIDSAFKMAAIDISKCVYTVMRFFRDVFLPHINDIEAAQRDELLIDGLLRLDTELRQVFQTFPCIPAASAGELIRLPCELIDPTSPLAVMYTPADGLFPCQSFCSADVLAALRQLGMRHSISDVTWNDLILQARTIAALNITVKLHDIVSGLLNILAHKLSDEQATPTSLYTIQQSLCHIAFLPTMEKPKNFPLLWFCVSGALQRPVDLFPPECYELICCVRPVTDSRVFPRQITNSPRLETFLQLDASQKIPGIIDVLDQLEAVVNHCVEHKIANKTGEQFDEFQRVLMRICDFIQSSSINIINKKIICERLSNCRFILISGHLVLPSQVAVNFPHNCAPYLFGLPHVYKHRFSDLMSLVGVVDSFSSDAYVTALRTMHDHYLTEPLNRDTLNVSLQLATLLNNEMSHQGQTMAHIVQTNGLIFIPDAAGILRSSAELCYNEPDCQWMPVSDTETVDNCYSHPLIPYTMSRQLGVSTRRHDMLQKHSRGLAFGQRERLTSRLRRILAAYPCDRELLNEMVQNADDAGASTIHFVKDPRQHGTEKLFDPAWKSLQGPALCIYNDRIFTEKDLTAIQRLGEGRKGTDPNATGQYGVGFNCVYHLTDVPSFLTGGPDSGGTLCVFDPHACYVPGATRDEPGRRFAEIQRLRQVFSDVFSCYLEDKGFNVSNGTMFRLPLRNETMSRDSELSDQIVSLETVDKLFTRFRPEMFDCLLFLNSVRSIHLSEIDKLTGKLTNTYTVTLQTPDLTQRDDFVTGARKFATDLTAGLIDISNIPEQQVVYTITLSDNRGFWEKWFVVQKVGFGGEIPASLLEAFHRGDLLLMPRGGVAALIDSSDARSVSTRRQRLSCFLPLPIKNDLPVSINGHFALDHESRRNLWTDDINGPKTLWNSLMFGRVVAPAYVTLLHRVSQSIGHSAEVLPTGSVASINQYCHLFPRLTPDVSGYWLTLIEAVYCLIASCCLPLFPVVITPPAVDNVVATSPKACSPTPVFANIIWLPISGDLLGCGVYFDNLTQSFPDLDAPNTPRAKVRRRLTSESNVRTGTRADILRQLLLTVGFHLVALPVDVCESFQCAGVIVSYVTPVSVLQFFSTAGRHTWASLPTHVSNTPFVTEATVKLVLDYCKQDSVHFYQHLNGLPLLLCQDGTLRKFSVDDPIFLSSHCDLLPGLESQFVHRVLYDVVFNETLVEDCRVFRSFSVEALAELLPTILNMSTYTGRQTRVQRPHEDNGPPSGSWLSRLWSYLRLQYEKVFHDTGSAIAGRETARLVVSALSDWCLLPIKVRSTQSSTSAIEWERYLVAVGAADVVFDFTSSGLMSNPVRRCLTHLAVPELDYDALDAVPGAVRSMNSALTNNSMFARLLVSTLDEPRSVLRSLSHVKLQLQFTSSRAGSPAPQLTRDECFTLLRYFADSLDSWQNEQDLVTILCSIPLHVSVTGEVFSLCDVKHTYMLTESTFPHVDLNVWYKHSHVVFLQFNPSLVELYNTLGCQTISLHRLYIDFILQDFQVLKRECQVRSLEFLRDVYLSRVGQDDRKVIIAVLRHLRFVPAADGKLYTASAFSDPYHAVFKEMLSGDKMAFPAAPFNEHKWLEFLRLVGLQTEVSSEAFVKFATSIAVEVTSSGATGKTFEKARTLVTHLFHMKDITSTNVLKSLANISFIPAARGNSMLQKILPPYKHSVSSTTPAYIAFHEAVQERYEALVWTSAYLLPDWANPYRLWERESTSSSSSTADYWREVAGQLGLSEKPAVSIVVKHVLNLCNQGNVAATVNSNQPEEVRAFMRADLMKKIYRYLQSSLSTDFNVQVIQEQLSNVACIIHDLGRTFLRPAQIVVNLFDDEQIIPYLYRLPPELGEFRELIVHLGATLNATPLQYSIVLQQLQQLTGSKRLHPNELRLTFKALRGLFKSLVKFKGQVSVINAISELYLPSTDSKLCRSTDLIFVDRPSWLERVHQINQALLVNLSECGMTGMEVDGGYLEMLRILPATVQPRILSLSLLETLDVRYSINRTVSLTAEQLHNQLCSKSFAVGLIRLIRHEHQRSGHKVKKTVLDNIRRQLEQIQVYSIDRVVTHLVNCTTNLPLANSDLELECFLERVCPSGAGSSEESHYILYINKTLSIESEELQAYIADAVNELSGSLLKNCVHYIRPILSCAPHAISRTLDRLRIRPDQGTITDDGYRRSALPTPGSFIPIEDHHLLQEDFVEFENGEYVGFELDEDERCVPATTDVTIVYAVIIRKVSQVVDNGSTITNGSVEHRDVTTNGTANHRELNGETLEGAGNTNPKKLKLDHSINILCAKYMVNIGDDRPPIVALSTSLYKFHRVDSFVSSPVAVACSPGGASNKSPKLSHHASFYSDQSVFEPEANGMPHNVGQVNGIKMEKPSVEKPSSGYCRASEKSLQLALKSSNYQKPMESDAKTRNASFELNQECEMENGADCCDDSDREKIVMQEVIETLEAAWKLPEPQRRKIVRRLLLRWHPDKNIGDEMFATTITQCIQAEMERLDAFQSLPDGFAADPRNPFSASDSFQRNFATAFKFFMDEMNERAKQHRTQRERYREHFTREFPTTAPMSGTNAPPPTFASSNPQPAQARRFLRQAREDLLAADNDLNTNKPAFEWVNFKVYQAAKKALKAALLFIDAVSMFSHDIVVLAASLDDINLQRLARQLQQLVGDATCRKMYAPDPLDYAIIPHDEHSETQARDAQQITLQILDRVTQIIELHN